MTRAAKAAFKVAATLAATIPVALSRLSADVILGVALLACIIVGALCWTITDWSRSERLAMLIDATRGNGRQVSRKLSRTDLPPPEPNQGKAAA